MMIYEHITNLSEQQSDQIKKATTERGWNQLPLDKNKMTKQSIAQSWEITKDNDEKFYDLMLDKHMLIYRLHSDEDENKYHRMMQWENEIRVRELKEEPIEQILKKIDEVSKEERDRLYLGNKLLRETQHKTRKEKVNSYLNDLEQKARIQQK